MGGGIWNDILFQKYLRNCSLIEGIRLESHTVALISVIWNGFVRTFGWISKALYWKVDSGNSVQVGVDPIVGLDMAFGLPSGMLDYLRDYGLKTLD